MNKFLEGLKRGTSSITVFVVEYLHLMLFFIGLIIIISTSFVLFPIIAFYLTGITLIAIGYNLKQTDERGGK